MVTDFAHDSSLPCTTKLMYLSLSKSVQVISRITTTQDQKAMKAKLLTSS